MTVKNNEVVKRLNAISDKICSEAFLRNEGLGNEIGFHVFDYPPEAEATVREHIQAMLKKLESSPNAPRILHINLFKMIVEYLRYRELLEEVIKLEKDQGIEQVKSAFEDLLSSAKLCEFLVAHYNPNDYQLVLLSGVGRCYPFLRAHSILNNLQDYMENIPLVLFYPGEYNGQSFMPFGLVSGKENYYRAFRLVE